MPDQLTDEAIAARVQQGDREAFATLVERYEEKLARYGKRFLSDQDDIRDVLQDVFVSAYTNIQSYQPARRFSPWVYRIAHNAFVNELRRKSKYTLVQFDIDTLFPHPISPHTPDAWTQEKWTETALQTCLSELPPKLREPIILSYFDEFSYEEISEILHIPTSTVGVRLHRGRQLLKEVYIKKYGSIT